MLIKRQYDEAGRVGRVLVKHTGLSPEQNFSRRLVLQAVTDGWMTLAGDSLTVKGEPEDLTYTIKRAPGYYCRSTGDRIPISELAWTQLLSSPAGVLSRAEALSWLASRGKSQDDYEITLAYECVLNAEQHAKFHAVRAVSGNLVAAQEVKEG